MNTQQEHAELVFAKICESVDQACKARDWFITSRVALSLGFVQTDVSNAFAYAQRFDFMIDPNIYICLNYRSLDPSGPFQPLPDVSKFEVTLAHDHTITKSYHNNYLEMSESSEIARTSDFSQIFSETHR